MTYKYTHIIIIIDISDYILAYLHMHLQKFAYIDFHYLQYATLT